MDKKLIASCGINCGLCLHYLRAENKCPGCNSGRKVNGRCIKCGIKLCKERKGKFCYECGKFPCARLKRLDERYRTKYDICVVDNLRFISQQGIKKFLDDQAKKFESKEGKLCMHNKKYYKVD